MFSNGTPELSNRAQRILELNAELTAKVDAMPATDFDQYLKKGSKGHLHENGLYIDAVASTFQPGQS